MVRLGLSSADSINHKLEGLNCSLEGPFCNVFAKLFVEKLIIVQLALYVVSLEEYRSDWIHLMLVQAFAVRIF